MRFAANSPKVGANPVFFTKNGFFEFAGFVLFVRQQTLARIDYLRASEMMVRKNGSFCVKFRA